MGSHRRVGHRGGVSRSDPDLNPVDRATVILLALLVAPISLVTIVALLRGYNITVVFHRDRNGRG